MSEPGFATFNRSVMTAAHAIHPPAMLPPAVPLPDVKALVESSRPRGMIRVLRPGYVLLFLVVGVAMALAPIDATLKGVLELLLWSAFVGSMIFFFVVVRDYRNEIGQLDQTEDLLALKRHHEVAPRLQVMMSRPMRTQQNRLRAMVLLASTLARLGRHEDALMVYNELVDTERLAGPSGTMVKLGRAMAMLQSDHLYDADRAINDLRRLIDRGGAEAEMQQIAADFPALVNDPTTIAALRLVELYRDIKTGHTGEAIESFEQHRTLMRVGLGHRLGEACAMAAVAYDAAGRGDEARQAFADATSLQGVADLLNRYAELRPLIARYSPTPAPHMG